MKQGIDDKLYEIEVIEERDDQVKIHSKGYSSEYDEWRVKEDIVLPKEPEKYCPYEHHHQLVYAIKSALSLVPRLSRGRGKERKREPSTDRLRMRLINSKILSFVISRRWHVRTYALVRTYMQALTANSTRQTDLTFT